MIQIIESILNTHTLYWVPCIYYTLHKKMNALIKKCKIKCINGLFGISGGRAYRGTVGKGAKKGPRYREKSPRSGNITCMCMQ